MAILSVQSSVAYGHVGNAAAVFALRRTGHDVWPIDTVRYSNHPGHGRFRGRRASPEEIGELVGGLADLGVLPRIRAVLSGYLGAVEAGPVLLDAVARVRAANPRALFFCDPVMGDRDRGLYGTADLVRFFREDALPAADIIAPNHFELEVLAERVLPSTKEVLAAKDMLAGKTTIITGGGSGLATILVTSLLGEEADPGSIATLARERDGAWRVITPRLAHAARGAGDLLAALFLGHRLDERPVADALARAVASVFAVIEATVAAGADELRLVEAQQVLIDPPVVFAAERLG